MISFGCEADHILNAVRLHQLMVRLSEQAATWTKSEEKREKEKHHFRVNEQKEMEEGRGTV